MKYAIMSDIHGNLEALQAAVADAKEQGVTKYICLGDVVGYGPYPLKCIQFAQKTFDTILLGNHEAGTCGKLSITWFSDTAKNGVLYTRSKIGDEERKWMEGLPYTHMESLGNDRFFACAHGTPCQPVEDFDYILDGHAAAMALDEVNRGADCNLLFFGHTHSCEYFVSQKGKPKRIYEYYDRTVVEENAVVRLEDGLKYAVNVGSVGYPRITFFSSYVIYDTEKNEVHYRILPFDPLAYAKGLDENGIRRPSWLLWMIEKPEELQKAKKLK